MSPILVALMFSSGVGVWVYSKIMRSTGGNTQNSLIVAGITGVIAFVGILIILNIVEKMLK